MYPTELSELSQSENEHFLLFHEKLKQMIDTIKDNALTLPERIGNIKIENDFLNNIYKEAYQQAYRYKFAFPGQMIKLTSTAGYKFENDLAQKQKNYDLYIVKNAMGFKLLLQDLDDHQMSFYELELPQITLYSSFDALLDRIEYAADYAFFSCDIHITTFLKGLKENKEKIKKLEINQPFKLDIVLDADQLSVEFEEKISLDQKHKLKKIKEKPFKKLHLFFVKTIDNQYRAFLKTSNIKEPFLRIDCFEKKIYVEYQGLIIEKKALEFINRLQKAALHFDKQGLQKKLKGYIKHEELDDIYDFVTHQRSLLFQLTTENSFRISKATHHGAHTLNVIRNHEYMLILETNTTIGKGSYSCVKLCFRIDTNEPEAWANKLMYNQNIKIAVREAFFSQYLLKAVPEAADLYNITFLGAPFLSKNKLQICQYSPKALGDLTFVQQSLTLKNVRQLMPPIFKGLLVFQKIGFIYGDLKPDNLYIYVKEGELIAKIGDFGISQISRYPFDLEASATYSFASPEIIMAHADSEAKLHDYFHHMEKYPLAYRFIPEALFNLCDSKCSELEILGFSTYLTPALENDKWSLAVLMFLLIENRIPDVEDLEYVQNHQLYSEIFKPRTERPSMEHMIELYDEYINSIRLPSPAEVRQAESCLPKPQRKLPVKTETIPLNEVETSAKELPSKQLIFRFTHKQPHHQPLPIPKSRQKQIEARAAKLKIA